MEKIQIMTHGKKIDWNDEVSLRAAFAELEDEERESAKADIFTRIKEKYTEKELIEFEVKARERLLQRGLQESDPLLALIILTELTKSEALSFAIFAYRKQQETLCNWDYNWDDDWDDELTRAKL